MKPNKIGKRVLIGFMAVTGLMLAYSIGPTASDTAVRDWPAFEMTYSTVGELQGREVQQRSKLTYTNRDEWAFEVLSHSDAPAVAGMRGAFKYSNGRSTVTHTDPRSGAASQVTHGNTRQQPGLWGYPGYFIRLEKDPGVSFPAMKAVPQVATDARLTAKTLEKTEITKCGETVETIETVVASCDQAAKRYVQRVVYDPVFYLPLSMEDFEDGRLVHRMQVEELKLMPAK